MTPGVPSDLPPRLASVVAFEMGGELMAVPTDILREVLEPPHVTRVPCTDEFSAGLINVRGVILPVTDLRPLFVMPAKDADNDTRILVLEIEVDDQVMPVGIYAEKVHAIAAIESDTLQPVPTVGTRWPTGTLYAMGRWNDRFVALPNIEQIFQNQLAQPVAMMAAE